MSLKRYLLPVTMWVFGIQGSCQSLGAKSSGNKQTHAKSCSDLFKEKFQEDDVRKRMMILRTIEGDSWQFAVFSKSKDLSSAKILVFTSATCLKPVTITSPTDAKIEKIRDTSAAVVSIGKDLLTPSFDGVHYVFEVFEKETTTKNLKRTHAIEIRNPEEHPDKSLAAPYVALVNALFDLRN